MYIKMEWIENTENKHETVDFICEYVSPGNKQIFHLSITLWNDMDCVCSDNLHCMFAMAILVCSNIEYRTWILVDWPLVFWKYRQVVGVFDL